ncbi:Hpt domain-containing protein [Maribacter sp. ACAM166]|uniref:Hpt domain-containing protein n=1 Tax=Maribacter sp. ACAM166 TaxID=2508996 RepID=UPI0010FDFC10|nr:Hpt domain-containing protein [Maribacter sp. ACAM166]TLP76789.1 Hpt domain-containing protein [Maribacter sp. ACAM166]
MIDLPNLDYINELAGDDIGFRNEFIAVIKEEFPVEKDEYLKHITKKRFKSTAAIVHKLKHKLNIFGMEKSYNIAVDYERELLAGQNDSEKRFINILETIESYIKTI